MRLKQMGLNRRKEIITGYAMLLPDVLGLTLFSIFSIIFAFYISLHQWNGLTEMSFFGITNYKRLIMDQEFWHSVWVTLKYSLVFVPSVYCVSLFLALLVEALSGKKQQFFRTMYFLPFSISLVVAAVVWQFLFDIKNGYINSIIGLLGLEAQRFLASTSQALYCIAMVNVWVVIGYNMIIFIAALKDIPQTYFEAADIDGANDVQKFFYIMLPLIKNASFFIIVITTIISFQAFDIIRVLTNGGPAQSTNVTVLFIFREAFQLQNFGRGSAAAFLLFAFIMVLTIVQMKLIGNKKGD